MGEGEEMAHLKNEGEEGTSSTNGRGRMTRPTPTGEEISIEGRK